VARIKALVPKLGGYSNAMYFEPASTRRPDRADWSHRSHLAAAGCLTLNTQAGVDSAI